MRKLIKKDLISILDLTEAEIKLIFELTKKIKNYSKKNIKWQPLRGKTLGMIFQKPSTRTRISFEVGMYQLGGQALFLDANELQLSRGETIKDTALVMSRYLDAILIRAPLHQQVLEFAKFASVPVINGLTDLLHPCQVLSDIFTILEYKKQIHNLKIVYIGYGNNVANSLAEIAGVLKLQITFCTPEVYQPDKKILTAATQLGGQINILTEPEEALKDADIIYTDRWVSMEKEPDELTKKNLLSKYQVNQRLVNLAKTDVLIMHCLPAKRGEEITDEVIDSKNSIVLEQAENRLHTQKAILTLLIRH